MKILSPIFLISILSIGTTSCVFDDDFEGSSESSDGQTRNFTFHPTNDVELSEEIEGDFDGFMIHSGNQSIDNKSSILSRADLESHDRDLAGFIAERPALQDGNSAKAIADSLERKLFSQEASSDSTLVSLVNFSVVSEQTYAGLGAINKRLSLNFSQSIEPTTLARSLAQLLGTTTENGTVDSWPSADSDEATSFNYTMYMTVIFVNAQQVVTMVSVSPSELSNDYVHILRSTTTPTNITQLGTVAEAETQNFIAEGGGGVADFLFVVDDSGSMSSYQNAVRDAAEIFSTNMQSSGLDFEIATITTGSTVEFQDSNQNGGFTNDLEEYKIDVTPGTSGSPTETGIYNAEQALLSVQLGDEVDGIVTASNHPRENANLSVIILSDEISQYTSRGSSEFNADSNLFIDRQYRVYAIVDARDNNRSQYDDLANSSGGSTADINSTANFPIIFEEIATLAGAASSRYSLEFTPIESSIEVRVNNSLQDRSNTNGWQYIIGSNAILFRGAAVPKENDEVSINYQHLPLQFWFVEPASSVDALFN